MKKIIFIILILLSGICYGQDRKLDSVRIVYDKDGNVTKKEYYSKKQFVTKSGLNYKVKLQDEKSPINKN